MANFAGVIRSESLQMDTHLNVVLPYDFNLEGQQDPCKVLYLFHGLNQGSDSWMRRSNVERYARERGIALIMPEVGRSFYLDLYYGENYFTYVTQELPCFCRQMFRISDKREDTFVAGLSMGGYGALKCAYTYPENYAGAASFSGAVDLVEVVGGYRDTDHNKYFIAALGPDTVVPDELNIFSLAEKAAPGGLPRTYLSCGEQDNLLEGNERLRDHLAKLGQPAVYQTWPGGHDWDFWDASIIKALDFFLEK